MRLFLISLITLILLATSASWASAATLDLTPFGSGNQIGQQQGVVAKVTNSSTQPLVAKACLLYDSYKKYLTLEKNVAGSANGNCVTLTSLAVGASGEVRWTLLGQQRTTKTEPNYQVNLYQVEGDQSTLLTSAKAPFRVSPIPAAFTLSPVSPTTSKSLQSLTLGDLRTVTYRVTNQGGSSASNWWMCFSLSNYLNAVRTSSYSSRPPRCAGGSIIYAGRSEMHTFTFNPIRPGKGHIYLKAGFGANYSNRVAQQRISFSVKSYNAFMLATPMKKIKGGSRQRNLVIKNTGASSPSLRACVKVLRGSLVSWAGSTQSCYFIGPIKRGKNVRLPLIVKGTRSAARVTINVPDTKAKTITRTFDFAS